MTPRARLPGSTVARGLPSSPDEIRDRFVWRVLRMVTVLMVPTTLAYAVAYVLRGSWLVAAVEVVGGLMMGAAYVAARLRRDPIVGLQWLSAVTWVLLAAVVVLHGGLRSPALLWLAMLSPLMFLAGAPMALAAAGLTIAFTLLLYVAEVAGALPAFTDVPLIQRVVSACVIVVLFVIFARNALAWRNGIADQLLAARDAAIAANRLQDRFIANLNHELRTPLNAIIGSAQLLASRSDDPEQRRLLEALQRSSDHLLALVNDVLDHSRLQAGMVELESVSFSLGAQLRNVVAMFAPVARAKGLSLQLQIDAGVVDIRLGDPTSLRQVVANLLSNAIKFTPSGDIVLRAIDERGAVDVLWCRLEVEDSGPGVPPSLMAHLFEPFTQADASISRKHGGTGLGLSICRELVDLMGGSIRVEVIPAGGARFVVRLPLSPSTLPAPIAAQSPGAPEHDVHRVLLVEDEPVNRMIAETMLQRLGMSVLTAPGGAEALAAMEHEPFDLVLMDLQMPGVDGITACRMRREHESTRGLPHTPIVALTGEVHEATRQLCVAAGMDGFLTKPTALAELGSLLDGLRRPAVRLPGE